MQNLRVRSATRTRGRSAATATVVPCGGGRPIPVCNACPFLSLPVLNAFRHHGSGQGPALARWMFPSDAGNQLPPMTFGSGAAQLSAWLPRRVNWNVPAGDDPTGRGSPAGGASRASA